jgi:hypothetical protein
VNGSARQIAHALRLLPVELLTHDTPRDATESDIQYMGTAAVKEPKRTDTCCTGNLLPICLNPRVKRR